MEKKLFSMLAALFMFVCIASAQTSVTGVVTTMEEGESVPVIGATVLVKGVNPPLGAITDVDGAFTIENVPTSATHLTVSFVGYMTEEVAIVKGQKVSIVMKLATEALDEVVVTAQVLTRKEKSIGYSAQKVAGEKLTAARQTDLGNAMAGKIAGARFFGASGATFDSGTIVLRGSTDFTSPAGSEGCCCNCTLRFTGW